jgi:hypothetical protein
VSSDVFVISTVLHPELTGAIRMSVERAGIDPARVQDAVLFAGGIATMEKAQEVARGAGLSCPAVTVASGIRALMFAAQEILSEDAELLVAAEIAEPSCGALVLAGPEAVGRWNLMPRGRLAARSLAGEARALKAAGIESEALEFSQEGESLTVVCDLLDRLEDKKAQWGMVSSGMLAIVLERL